RKAVRFIGPVFKKYNKKFRKIPLYLRADSGFAKPGIYRISEEHNIFYTIRLKANAKLYKLAKPFEEKLVQKVQGKLHKKQVVYGQFNYKAGSWNKERKVIVKIEKPKGQLTYNYTFIVTNIQNWSANQIVKFYCQRGTMENFIKEGKNGFAFGKMSSSEYWSNANKLQQMVLAYNLNNWMRRLCFPQNNKSDRINTIRTKIIKIAGIIVKAGRYIYYKLASSCPNKKLFFSILSNIQRLVFV
ncbi:MAG: IS1380 family transposase, partial [Candidatus Woesearchaeota archaeon]